MAVAFDMEAVMRQTIGKLGNDNALMALEINALEANRMYLEGRVADLEGKLAEATATDGASPTDAGT